MKTIFFLLAGFIMMLLMGTVYAWSVFRSEVEMVYTVSTLQSGTPYMVSLFFYALFMMISGKKLNDYNTRKLAFIGFLLIGLGWLLSFTFNNFLMLVISYGVLIGAGVGIVYGIPIYIINKKYQRSGLYTGIILSGFGASPLVTAPLIFRLINEFSLHQTFLIMSIMSALIFLPMSFLLKCESCPKKTNTVEYVRYNAKTFYLMYIIFLLGTTIGLMVIGLSYQLGTFYYGFSSENVTFMIALFAVFNGISRPIFGWIIDKKGFIFAIKLSVWFILLATIIGVINQGQYVILFALSIGIYWFNLGAFLVMMPSGIKSFFGTTFYAKFYGKMFTSYGIGAIIGTIVSGVLLDLFHQTNVLYGFILLLVSILLIVIYRLNNVIDNNILN